MVIKLSLLWVSKTIKVCFSIIFLLISSLNKFEISYFLYGGSINIRPACGFKIITIGES